MNNVFVERETFETNGKTYFTYFVRGNVRGKDVKACVVPPDLGGYAVLDIVFNGEKSAELVSTPFEMKDDHNKVISGCTYSVRSTDENGKVYECKIKPFRNSDKTILNMLLR